MIPEDEMWRYYGNMLDEDGNYVGPAQEEEIDYGRICATMVMIMIATWGTLIGVALLVGVILFFLGAI